MKIRANGIDIEVEDTDSGPDQSPGAAGAARPAVLLIMGLGMQLIAWPPQLVQALVNAGYRVIRHDNRDGGLSQHLDNLGKPHLVWQSLKLKLGLTPRLPYSMSDMAADSLGVLDALGIAQAHVVGASMGGMIAQRVALAAPQRVLSLTSMMSSSGAKGLPQASPEVFRALLRRPVNNSPQALADHYVRLFQVIGSPAFATPEPELRDRILLGVERGFYREGTLRQMLAIMADTARAAQLERLRVPTLVLHGKADPLVPYACAEDTARRIAGAKLVGIEGMGHDLPPGLLQPMLDALIPHFRAADAQADTADVVVGGRRENDKSPAVPRVS